MWFIHSKTGPKNELTFNNYVLHAYAVPGTERLYSISKQNRKGPCSCRADTDLEKGLFILNLNPSYRIV